MTTTDTTDPWRDENDTSIAASRSETRRPTVGDAPTPNLADALEFDATYWRDLHWIIELADRQDAAASQLRQLDRIKAERDALLSSLDELWDWAIDACVQGTNSDLRDPTWHMFMSTWEHADELLPRVWGLLVQIRLGDALEVSDV